MATRRQSEASHRVSPSPRLRVEALRDGVTGNTSGFELEDEGSTPSPAAIPFFDSQRYFD